MTPDRPRPRSRRRLTADEHALWTTVTRSVAPLRKVKRSKSDEEAAGAAPVAATTPQPRQVAVTKPAAQSAKPKPPPLAPLARRAKQRIARGAEPINLRIDLHGLTQEQAHNALRRFLRNAQVNGAKLVLVITGKGARASGLDGSERGVLKRLVPQWLQLPDMRPFVLGFEAAHVTHGGEGALYVRVRPVRG